MKALCWHGKNDVRIDTVPAPEIEDPRDAIIRVTATAICGIDLHLLDGYMPMMEAGVLVALELGGLKNWVHPQRQVRRMTRGTPTSL